MGAWDDNSQSNNTSSSSIDIQLSALSFHSPGSSQQLTPDIASPMTSLNLSSQESEFFFPPVSSTPIPLRKGGRPTKGSKFRRNQYTRSIRETDDISSHDDSIFSSPTRTSVKRVKTAILRRGYTSRIFAPIHQSKRYVTFECNNTTKHIKASKPSGMRILDISIIAEAMTKIACSQCHTGYLSLYKSDFLHGWQTDFYLKCSHCNHQFADFPSSKPMEVPERTNFVNVLLPKRDQMK
ncbi:hypothetical protein LOD99_11208 [Oopsacas minuta]|uniref:Uncharacterized protein n=1 Tax=Oopsacas minuta TaxID=111878 RepID=A0AAV7K702_9METZ|nr:hypothetical protein LOD99_11208 [Oopsacas minuta]